MRRDKEIVRSVVMDVVNDNLQAKKLNVHLNIGFMANVSDAEVSSIKNTIHEIINGLSFVEHELDDILIQRGLATKLLNPPVNPPEENLGNTILNDLMNNIFTIIDKYS